MTADTYVDSAHASVNYLDASKLRLQGSGATAYGYEMIKPPVVGPDVLYTSAVMRYYAATTWSTSCTLTGRRLTSSKAFSTITSASQPTNTATGAASAAIGTRSIDTAIDLDVTALVQGWATGAFPNYGMRLDVGAVSARLLHAAQTTKTDLRPALIYTVYRKPGVPAVTAPKAGQQVTTARPTLTWTPPTDPLALQVSYQVQMSETDGVWSTYDSGEVASTAGQHLVTFDIADGETWFYRIRIKNEGGQWSDWTTGQEFGRADKPTFTIIQPTGGVWTDSTPAVEWSALSAGTQVQYRVQHLVDGVVKVDSKILTGADTSWTFPTAIPGFDGGDVTTRVSLLDDANRAATPGDSPWIVVEEVWTYTPGATDPVDSIDVSQHPSLPVPLVSFERASSPDRWEIRRSIASGPWESIAIVDGPDLHTTGTSYEFVDVTAPPFRNLSYQVVAGENSIDSDDNPVDTVRIVSDHLWLLDPADDSFWAALAGVDSLDSFVYTEESEAVYPRGADRPQVTFDGFRGFEGTVTGSVYGTDSSPHLGRTAQEMRDAIIFHVKSYPTRVLRFIAADYNLPVIVRNATPQIRPDAELEFGISMTLEQYGEVPWNE